MVNRNLGATGMQVSEVAFGGVEIGIPYGIGIESTADMITEAQALELLHASFDQGINFYDTARLYGKSESLMGKAFQDRRQQVVISTKCAHFADDEGAVSNYPQLQRIVETSLKESLHALKTDYLDIFMLHQGTMRLLENDNVLRIFSDLKKSGIVRATGVSTYTPEETRHSIETGMWDVIQLPFNLMDQRQSALFHLASEAGVGIVVRSVLMKGLLSNRAAKLHPALHAVENHIRSYGELLDESGLDLSSLATKFALAFPEVSSILVGLDRMEYLHQCVEACSNNVLDKELLQRVKQLAYGDPGFLNMQTWSKNGWFK